MPLVYLSLGSNLGDRELNLSEAISLLEEKSGTVKSVSSVYSYEPWGYKSNNQFLNQVIGIETHRSPSELLKTIKEIELSMGRIRHGTGYSDRIIDIDILLYADFIISEGDIIIPHPLMEQRLFVLEPLSEIAGDVVHPLIGKSIDSLLADLSAKAGY